MWLWRALFIVAKGLGNRLNWSTKVPNHVQNSMWPELRKSEHLPGIFQILVEGIGYNVLF